MPVIFPSLVVTIVTIPWKSPHLTHQTWQPKSTIPNRGSLVQLNFNLCCLVPIQLHNPIGASNGAGDYGWRYGRLLYGRLWSTHNPDWFARWHKMILEDFGTLGYWARNSGKKWFITALWQPGLSHQTSRWFGCLWRAPFRLHPQRTPPQFQAPHPERPEIKVESSHGDFPAIFHRKCLS